MAEAATDAKNGPDGGPEFVQPGAATKAPARPSDTFAWTEKEGVWRRKLGSMESFYLTLASPDGQPVHWMIGCCVTLTYHGNNDGSAEEALRAAWETVREEFPSVSAVVDRAAREMVVDTGAPTAAWARDTFRVHDGVTADGLFAAFTSQMHISLHYLRDTHQLVIQAPHVLLDGRGALYLYDALFTALARPKPGGGGRPPAAAPPNLTKPYDYWLGVSEQPSPRHGQDAGSLFGRVLQQQAPIRLPGVDFTARPRKTVHQDLRLDEATTSAIIAACKQRGVSVTSAWHAALAMATKKIQAAAGESGESYVQFTTIDLRRHFPAGFAPSRDSIGSLQTALPLEADAGAGATFAGLSAALHAQYRAPFAFAGGDFGFLAPYMAASRRFVEGGGAPPSSTPSLSSMGVIDDYLRPRYGDWEVAGFWISSTMLTGDFQMYLWTFRGRMAFSVCYNDAYYGAGRAAEVLERTRDEMLAGLGLRGQGKD